ncbi:MAG: alpha-glucan family phosphorylase [Myxococcota bacterium]
MSESARVAYFSMEIALESSIPTYSGGLGVLAGDTLRSAADLCIPMVAVSLVHRRGYFLQQLDPATGQQVEAPADWPVERLLEPVAARVAVEVEGREVVLRAWRYRVEGVRGAAVPVYLLDAALPENAEPDRALTDALYGGDGRYRLAQEIVLGIGGLRMLRAIGYGSIRRFHLNEGHAALVGLALLDERLARTRAAPTLRDLATVRSQCVFTTHTPVPAGHDVFPGHLVERSLGATARKRLALLGQEDVLNMTDLALQTAHFVNGVAMRHGEVSRSMFPAHPIRSITNGIHTTTWATPALASLFDRAIPSWRRDPLALRDAIRIPLAELREAHAEARRALIARVERETDAGFREDCFTIGFARRATAYKRPTLIFHDLERLASIAREHGALQLVFAGKAHPRDEEGKARIREIFGMRERLRGRVRVAYLEGYDMDLGRLVCGGCDLWLNTPIPPLEASGTSGMKAALNGVPSLSILDGWWLEGHVEGVTGWSIGDDEGPSPPATFVDRDAVHADALYAKLADVVLPCFYATPDRYLETMRSAIQLNGSFFNTQRMLSQYLYEAYFATARRPRGETF